jgi:sulfur relay (sulfurtransferase) DsrC/TusE family protein
MKKQLKIGIGVEREHKSTVSFLKNYIQKHKRLPPERTIYRSIASDHLKENRNYYNKLRRCKL